MPISMILCALKKDWNADDTDDTGFRGFRFLQKDKKKSV